MGELQLPADFVVDGNQKGFPASLAPTPASEVGRLGLNVLAQDVEFPAAVLKSTALQHNRRWMQAFLAKSGALLAPHGKTTMSPELIRMQLSDGAWAITAATSLHIRAYQQAGVRRILHANQLVGAANIRGVFEVLADDSELDFYTLADSSAGLDQLRQGLLRTPIGRPLQLLIEMGAEGGRTGTRTEAQALALAREVHTDPRFCLAGVECFEGVYSGRAEEDDVGARDLLVRVATAAGAMHSEGLFDVATPIFSAGGSSYFALASEMAATRLRPATFQLVLRSGCYLTHDSSHYRAIHDRLALSEAIEYPAGGLRAALELWGCVQSRPEPCLALINLGKRDVSHDIDLPIPLWVCGRSETRAVAAPSGCKVKALADQHLFLELPEAMALEVGDLVGFGISHPCTTFDKWKAMMIVDDEYRVVSVIHTCF